jgi:hypothetical protein
MVQLHTAVANNDGLSILVTLAKDRVQDAMKGVDSGLRRYDGSGTTNRIEFPATAVIGRSDVDLAGWRLPDRCLKKSVASWPLSLLH